MLFPQNYMYAMQHNWYDSGTRLEKQCISRNWHVSMGCCFVRPVGLTIPLCSTLRLVPSVLDTSTRFSCESTQYRFWLSQSIASDITTMGCSLRMRWGVRSEGEVVEGGREGGRGRGRGEGGEGEGREGEKGTLACLFPVPHMLSSYTCKLSACNTHACLPLVKHMIVIYLASELHCALASYHTNACGTLHSLCCLPSRQCLLLPLCWLPCMYM